MAETREDLGPDHLGDPIDPDVLVGPLYNSVLFEEWDAISTRLWAEHEPIYDDIERLHAEADLRLSIAPPIAVIVIVLGPLWCWWALLGLVFPWLLFRQGTNQQARANNMFIEVLTHGVVSCLTFERIRSFLQRHQDELHASPKARPDN